jgi:hypothetical protein
MTPTEAATIRKAQATWSITAPDLVSLAAHCDPAGQRIISGWLTAMDLRAIAQEAKSTATPKQLGYLASLTGKPRDFWTWAVGISFEDCGSLITNLLENGRASYRGEEYSVTVSARKSHTRSAKRAGKSSSVIPF